MEEAVSIFVAEEMLLLVPRQISYDVAPVTADHVTVTLAVDVPSVALTFAGAETRRDPLMPELNAPVPTAETALIQ